MGSKEKFTHTSANFLSQQHLL